MTRKQIRRAGELYERLDEIKAAKADCGRRRVDGGSIGWGESFVVVEREQCKWILGWLEKQSRDELKALGA